MPRLPARLLRASPAVATAAVLTTFLLGRDRRPLEVPEVERHEPAGLRADLYAPPGRRSPGIVLVLGALREGRRYPLLERLARTVAGCGFAVLVPELGRLRDLVLDDSALEDLVGATLALPDLPGVEPAPVGLYGFSLGGSLALVAAADPRLAGRLAFVASLGGYWSLLDMLVAATATDDLEPPSRFAVAASVVALAGGPDASSVEALLDRRRDDPIAALREVDAAGCDERTRSALDVLTNRDPAAAPGLLARLPGAAEGLARLSPETSVARVEAPAWILHDERDRYVPVAQARRLQAAVRGQRNFHVATINLLEHTEPVHPGWAPAALLGDYLPGTLHVAGFVRGPLRALRSTVRQVAAPGRSA